MLTRIVTFGLTLLLTCLSLGDTPPTPPSLRSNAPLVQPLVVPQTVVKGTGQVQGTANILTTPAGTADISITAFEPISLARTNEPISIGVPTIPNCAVASLFDGVTEVAAQFRTMLGTGNWCFLDFQASIGSGASKTWTIKLQAPIVSPAIPLIVTDTASQVRFDGGPLLGRFSKTAFNGLDIFIPNSSQSWLENTPSPSGDSMRAYSRPLYDPDSDCFLYYDGNVGSNFIYSNAIHCYKPSTDTWTRLWWSGTTTTCPAVTSTSPGHKHPYAQWTYDTRRKRFYSYSGACLGETGNILHYFTHNGTADSGAWVQATSGTPNPGGIFEAVMVFIPGATSADDRLFLYGDDGQSEMDAAWEYNIEAGTWTELCDPCAPGRRGGHMMVYEPNADKVIMFGGYTVYITADVTDTYQYDPRVSCTPPNCSGRFTNRNAAGSYPVVVYPCTGWDDRNDRILYYQGPGSLHQYKYSTNTWTNLSITGGPDINQKGREWGGCAYHEAELSFIAFMDNDFAGAAAPPRLWELDYTTQIFAPANAVSVTDNNGTVFPTSAVTPTVTQEFCGPLRCQYMVEGPFAAFPNGGFGWRTRIDFYAGKSTIRVEWMMRNSMQNQVRHQHLNDSAWLFGSSTQTQVRATGRHSRIRTTYPGNQLSLRMRTTGEDANTGFPIQDWSYRVHTFWVDFTGNNDFPESAARSPIIPLPHCSIYTNTNRALVFNSFCVPAPTNAEPYATEKDVYVRWGLAQPSPIPTQAADGTYTLLAPTIGSSHGDPEEDDVAQNLYMFLRAGGRAAQYGYFHRTRGWADFIKFEFTHRTDGFDYRWDSNYEQQPGLARTPTLCVGCTATDNTFISSNWDNGGETKKVDLYGSQDFGADHLFGWGCVDLYHLIGDTECLRAVADLSEIANAMEGYRPATTTVSFFDPRQEARHGLITQMACETLGGVHCTYRNSISTHYQNATDWNATWGIYVTGDSHNNTPGCTNTANRNISMFQPHLISRFLDRYCREDANCPLGTGSRAWARDRLIAMGNFMDANAILPSTSPYTANRMWLDCMAPGQISADGSNSDYTPKTADVSVIAYLYDGQVSHLTAAKTRWLNGLEGAFESSFGACNQPCEYVNQRRVGDGTYFWNNGHLIYGLHLLKDGQ